jgi:hypothetical protein
LSGWDLAAPDAVAALVVAAQTIQGPTVHDSIVLSDDGAVEVIVVAGSVNRPDTARQEINREWIEHRFEEPGYNMDQADRFTVWSEVAVLNADADMPAARRRAYEIIRDWGRVIADDPSLGGVVDKAWLSEIGWKPRIDGGAVAIVLVGVDVQAFTGP